MKTVGLIGFAPRELVQFSYHRSTRDHHLSVDEICRRPIDSQGFPFGFFTEDQFYDGFVFQADRKFLEIESDFFCNLLERRPRVMVFFPFLLPL